MRIWLKQNRVAPLVIAAFALSPCTPWGACHGQVQVRENHTIQTIAFIPNPPVGTDWTFTVPAGQQYEFKACRAILTTSATVAIRSIAFNLKDASVLQFNQVIDSIGVTASQTKGINLSVVSNNYQSVNTHIVPLPSGMLFPAGSTLSSSTLNLQAGDQWSNVVCLVEVYP